MQKYQPWFDGTVIVVFKIIHLSHKEIFFCAVKVLVWLKISKRVVNSVIQTVHDGRQFMKYIDPKLGVALPERDYGGNCLIYDPGNATDPFHNLWVRWLFISFKLWFISGLMLLSQHIKPWPFVSPSSLFSPSPFDTRSLSLFSLESSLLHFHWIVFLSLQCSLLMKWPWIFSPIRSCENTNLIIYWNRRIRSSNAAGKSKSGVRSSHKIALVK